MPEIVIDFEVWCSCGNGLCSQTDVQYGRSDPTVVIEPCENCLIDARNEGFQKGYDEGFRDGCASTP